MSHDPPLSITPRSVDGVPVVVARGVLDSTTYLDVRNAISKAAIEAPTAVVVDVVGLRAPVPSAWSVLTSAAWLIRDWPGIELCAVADPAQQLEIAGQGIGRYINIHSSIADALYVLRAHPRPAATAPVLRARNRIPRGPTVMTDARGMVRQTLRDWDRPECVVAASVVTTILVENVMAHATSDPDVRVELRSDRLTIAVEDDTTVPAIRREPTIDRRGRPPGLDILQSIAYAWGNTPTAVGKTVWATLGPDQYTAFGADGGN